IAIPMNNASIARMITIRSLTSCAISGLRTRSISNTVIVTNINTNVMPMIAGSLHPVFGLGSCDSVSIFGL
ncbi:MAG: hypothetical protein QF535_10800, partial [Anaerolineales bacterium]|nr:hypothetical protein [Anaerolineales bacterium]